MMPCPFFTMYGETITHIVQTRPYQNNGGTMAKMIPAAERIVRARKLIEKARQVPVPETGKYDLSYIAEVKSILQQARDLVKFIPNTPTATPEMKEEVKKILQEADQANREILH
jgi:hypothetical protein